ncbi:MAG: histidine phosphatase family protein [Bacteroidales bacterium]|nr:histidine phosphatase family protein [Bacteroidales bacterium]
MIRKIAFSLILTLCLASLSFAQTSKDQIMSDITNFGNIYKPYPDEEVAIHKAPKGYKPFYITHLGRHGTRNGSSDKEYSGPYKYLRTADSLGVLTEEGKALYADVATLYEATKGHFGQLLPRGEREHRHIIQRMVANYPEVFRTKKGEHKEVKAISTSVQRVMMSMYAGMSELYRINPSLEISLCSDESVQPLFARPNALEIYKETKGMMEYSAISPYQSFNERIFTDDSFLGEKKYKPLTGIWRLAAASISTDLGLNLYKYLTVEELYPLWEQRNKYMYTNFGPSPQYGKLIADDLKPLLRRMIDLSEQTIEGKNDLCAAMHYAHDVHVIPFCHLIGIKDCSEVIEDLDLISQSWQDYRITPMGCNVQIIFFKKKNSDDILVKVLHNEHECELDLETDCWPFYHWSELKPYLESRAE